MSTANIPAKYYLAELLDSTYGLVDQSHTLTALARVADTTLRVRIKQNAYIFQSHAVIEVLNGNREWTALIAVSPDEFHTKLPSYVQQGPACRKALEEYAVTLFARGARILGFDVQ